MATRTSPSERLSPWTNSGRSVTSWICLPPYSLVRRTVAVAAGMIWAIATRSSSAGRPAKGRATNSMLCLRGLADAAAGRRPWRFFFDMPVSLPATWRPTGVDDGPSPPHDAPHGSSPHRFPPTSQGEQSRRRMEWGMLVPCDSVRRAFGTWGTMLLEWPGAAGCSRLHWCSSSSACSSRSHKRGLSSDRSWRPHSLNRRRRRTRPGRPRPRRRRRRHATPPPARAPHREPSGLRPGASTAEPTHPRL